MDIKKIKRLIELIENTSLSEIEIKEGEESVRLSRHTTVQPAAAHHVVIPNTPPAPTKETQSAAPEVPSPAILGHTIRSPMVGTFYASSSPEAQPFVQVGQNVNAGQVVCIVEAMKMFNEIESDRTGKVIEVLVKNGEPVEYDQPLFIIE